METLKRNTFFGREKDDTVYPIALANLLLHGIDEPRIWHGNTLSGQETYGDLFRGAPAFFDVVLMNPPFGGKEGKEAQTGFDYPTSATQVLFIQHVLKSMKDGSVCGIVLDEGVLFRTNESGFVGTKRKLMEECDVYCIVSLPGGVFSSAGAGVKTNLVFFRKGKPTETIWYFDLSDVKVGKKKPLTQSAFDDLFDLYPNRANSERSWAIDFAAKLEESLEEARPYREKAAVLSAEAKGLELKFKTLKKDRTVAKEKVDEAEQAWRKTDREARDNLAKAQEIEDAIYDIKAVNPNRKTEQDTRTPRELLEYIEQKGKEADAALARLRDLIFQAEDVDQISTKQNR